MASCSVLPLIAQRLPGKVALITGAASGMGAATAKLFARHGANVVVTDIQEDLGRALVEEIGPDSATFVYCDVTDESSVRDAVDAAVTQHGKLDILFSNAGIIGKPIPSILEADHDIIKHVLDVNVFGSFYCAKHAARVMIPAKKGCVLFNAGASTVVAFGDVSPHTYSVSKNAIMGLSNNVGAELGKHGIRVNCLSPYVVPTPLVMNALGMVDRRQVEELFEEAASLKGVVMNEDDMANAALYLASNDAKYVSGLNLVVDGGFSTTNQALTDTFKRFLAGPI